MSQDFSEMATELLNFIEIGKDDAEYAYRLQRTRTFLEMKFGHVEAMRRKLEILRDENRRMQPIVSRELDRQEAVRHNHPFRYLSEEG